MDSFVVIADDFTGANDTGMQFYNKGLSVDVLLSNDFNNLNSDIVVYNTDSRSMNASDAMDSVSKVIECCDLSENSFIYKKIDATLRGNIGSEIEAIIKATQFSYVVLCNALPNKNRTVEDGMCMYNGQGITISEFATDPKTPIISDSIKEIIASQSDIEVVSINRFSLHDAILSAQDLPDKRQIIVVDAKTNEDLFHIGKVIADLMDGGILVGSSGLAQYLPPSVYGKDSIKPSLVISGTMSPVTINQIKIASQYDTTRVYTLDIHKIITDQDYLDKCLMCILPILNEGYNCIIQSVKSEKERLEVDTTCAKYRMTRIELAGFISGFLGNLASAIVHRVSLLGILFTGGDIAISCAASMGSNSYSIQGEILPCIPVGYLDGIEQTLIATKAGSHGEEDALVKVIEFFRTKNR